MEVFAKISRNIKRIQHIHRDSGWGYLKTFCYIYKLIRTRGFVLAEIHDYEFDKYPKEYLDTFLNDKEQIGYLELLNPRKYYSLARNKYWTHVFLEKAGIKNKADLFCYYNPELYIAENHDIAYDTLTVIRCLKSKSVHACVIKATESSHGDNVFVIKSITYYETDAILEKYDSTHIKMSSLLSKEPLIFESLIHQTDQLSQINPSSVNTVRFMTTLMPDGTAKTIATFIKIGRAGKCVDNAGDGGNVDACIDVETGEIKYAIQYDGWRNTKDIEKHPDTNVQINGIVIENWDAIKKNVEQYQQALPFVKAAGWDIAITDDGPVVIEVNDMWDRTGQLFIRRGWKPEIEDCYNKWNKYYK